jgi:hypothetical protein
MIGISFFLLAFNLLLFAISFSHTQPITGRVQSDGLARFCINHAPSISIPCNTTLSQNQTYSCLVNLTDVDGQNVTVTSYFDTGQTFFNVSPDGNITTTPGQDAVGAHTIIFTADDQSNCENARTNFTWNITVANINDPPYLSLPIPDQQFSVNTSLAAFYLTDYFVDPDGDTLNFTSSTPSGFTVQILNSSQVFLSGNTCLPDGELITFTATDPYNASADSNAVTVRVNCPTGGSSSSSSSGGGGGGGGGGASYICRNNWQCEEWLSCLPTGWQWRRCYDKAGCDGEKYLKRTCAYQGPPPACEENWLCSEWGQCWINQTQMRTCEDLANCGTNVTLPPLTQSCVYNPTCNDNVQNGDETGVDCGGSCAPCALVEQPSVLSEGGISTWIIIALVLGVLLVSGGMHYYRAQIAQGIAILGFLLRRKMYRDILLDAGQRKALFEKLVSFEQSLAKEGPAAAGETEDRQATNKLHLALSEVIHAYLSEALRVPHESLPEEIDERMHQFALREETAAVIRGLLAKIPILEEEQLSFDRYFIMALLEEVRTAVCLTSEYTKEEIMRQIEEVTVDDSMSFYDEIFARTTNALRALQFGHVDVAEKEYLTILSRYDGLDEAEREQIYPQIHWVYTAIQFKANAVGARIIDKSAV